MSLPLDAAQQISTDPAASERLRLQFGGTREVDRDGSMYSSIGSRPVPPPKAMRLIHAERQMQRKQEEEDREAEATMAEYGMGVAECRTSMNLGDERSCEATRLRRELAQRDLEVPLCDVPYQYDIQGCALPECGGLYTYSEAARHGAPVYQNAQGWTLHRDRPPVQASVGTEREVSQFGWLITKDRRPFYAAKTDDMVAPSRNWECFLGPPPAPSCVTSSSWEAHLLECCGALKDDGNAAMKQSRYEHAHQEYSKAVGHMTGYDDVVRSSERLQQLEVMLYANRAEVRLRLCLWREAFEDCRWVLDRDPCHAKAVARLSKACRALGSWSEASGPLRRALQEVASQRRPEIQALVDEAALVMSCESGSSELSTVYREIQLAKEYLEGRRSRDLGDGFRQTATALTASLRRLDKRHVEFDHAGLLVQGTGLLDAVLASASVDRAVGDADWVLELLCGCAQPFARETDLRRLLGALPAVAPHLVADPERSLELIRLLLQHPLAQQLKAADSVIEARGLLPACLRQWLRLLDERLSHGSAEVEEHVVEVLHALGAQALRLDNVEALALALFVECFVGEKFVKEDGSKAVTGGFILYSGATVRQVVLSLLRRWAEDHRILESLSPELVGRVWLPVLTKLRRDVNVEVEKPIPSAPGGKKPLKLEWFKLKRGQDLRKGAFHPEEPLEALLNFLLEHLKATCARGPEREPSEGIAARNPAEEWLDEVLDRPFGWGVLLPLVVAPPPLSTRALALLEALIDRYPHSEKLAKRLAGLHVFMPLLGLPWPVGPQSAASHLGSTMSLGSGARCSVAKLLRCSIDTEIGLQVVQGHPTVCVDAVVNLLMGVLPDRDRPEAIIAAVDVLGILAGNLQCWDEVPEEAIFSIVEEFVHSTHAATRAQLGKLLRLAHADKLAGPRVQRSLEDARLGLDERQRTAALREVFDPRTLAGQAKVNMMMELHRKREQTPADELEGDEKTRQDMQALLDAMYEAYLRHLPSSRVLVLGRIARAIGRCLGQAQPSCRIVLGETTLERLRDDSLLPNVAPVLLPVPHAVANDPQLASQERFDLVIAGQPLGYCDIAEYAEQLRPWVRRRELEEEKQKDQVQWVCLELLERLEDARDELYSAGYYNADHDRAAEALRRLSRRMGHDVALFALPSEEKERRRQLEGRRAAERKVRRQHDEEAKAQREEEEERRRGVLYETLFDPVLSVPEAAALPVAFELGAIRGEEDLLLLWLAGNSEDPEESRTWLESLCEGPSGMPRLRIAVAAFPEGRTRWYGWTDEVAVNFGTEWFEMAEGPTKEDAEKAAKDPAANISFGKPSFEELASLEEMELCCKQLLNLADEEVMAGMRPSTKIAFGGFSQGGAVAAYAALSGLASEELRPRLCGVVPCCAGVPVLHFLAPKLRAACLSAREEGAAQTQYVSIHMVYGRDDPEVKESFVETSRDLYRRFDFPASLHRFTGRPGERFPQEVRISLLGKVLRALLA